MFTCIHTALKINISCICKSSTMLLGCVYIYMYIFVWFYSALGECKVSSLCASEACTLLRLFEKMQITGCLGSLQKNESEQPLSAVFKWKCKIFVFKGVYLTAESVQLVESYSGGNYTLLLLIISPPTEHPHFRAAGALVVLTSDQKRIPTSPIRTGKKAMAPNNVHPLPDLPYSEKFI